MILDQIWSSNSPLHKARLAELPAQRVGVAYPPEECPQCSHRTKPNGQEYAAASIRVAIVAFSGTGTRLVPRTSGGAVNIRRRQVAKRKHGGQESTGSKTRPPGAMASLLAGVRVGPPLSCGSRSRRGAKQIGRSPAVCVDRDDSSGVVRGGILFEQPGKQSTGDRQANAPQVLCCPVRRVEPPSDDADVDGPQLP